MSILSSDQFKKNASIALHHPPLQQALGNLKNGFVKKRALAKDNLPEFDQIRALATEIKKQTLLHLDYYLEKFEERVIEQGGVVHWAQDANEACQIAIQIAQTVNAKLITKSKSMLTEEIGLNPALIKAGFDVVETDLGEYIIQLRRETPSHIVVPAMHLLKYHVAETFRATHQHLNIDRKLDNLQQLLDEARAILRQKFLTADVGITGANFLIAENGETMIVTNEGNADLTQTCAKVHIVMAGIEKVIPTAEDAFNTLRLLSRSATGQEITTYVSFALGPRRLHDKDGPEQFHVILIDNGRSNMLGNELRDMLRCIRCGACLNHCPVYGAIGGQAYGSMYSGPMGKVLTPSLFGIKHTKDLPNASTFCGRCEQVCPMNIPLPTMMRFYREQQFTNKLSPMTERAGLTAWAFLAKRPWLYHYFIIFISSILRLFGKHKGSFTRLPFAKNWTTHRNFPVPTGKTFQQLWRKRQS